MKIVLTESELKHRYPGASDSDIKECFRKLIQESNPGPSYSILSSQQKKMSYNLEIGEFDPDDAGLKSLAESSNVKKESGVKKEFNQWTRLKISPKNHDRLDLFKDRFEWYCAGWLDFFDKIVTKGEEDHEIRFEWRDIDPSANKYEVTILIHPEYTGNPYYPTLPSNQKESSFLKQNQ